MRTVPLVCEYLSWSFESCEFCFLNCSSLLKCTCANTTASLFLFPHLDRGVPAAGHEHARGPHASDAHGEHGVAVAVVPHRGARHGFRHRDVVALRFCLASPSRRLGARRGFAKHGNDSGARGIIVICCVRIVGTHSSIHFHTKLFVPRPSCGARGPHTTRVRLTSPGVHNRTHASLPPDSTEPLGSESKHRAPSAVGDGSLSSWIRYKVSW